MGVMWRERGSRPARGRATGLSLKTIWILLHLVSSPAGKTYKHRGPPPTPDYNDSSNLVDASYPVKKNKQDTMVYIGRSRDPWGASAPLLRQEDEEDKKSSEQESSSRRPKRGVFHLYNMVKCATGCNPLAYKGYGCYCGFLGSGYTVDGIDSCCRMHDWCYNTANCPMFLEYFVPYLWKCYRRKPLCALEQGGTCAHRLCECDRQLAECLRRYPCPRTKAVCTSSPWRLLQNVFML